MTAQLPLIDRAAGDASPLVRVRAAQVIDQWGASAQALPVIARLLADMDPATRSAAALALGSLKKDAGPLIQESLRSEHPEVRLGALKALDNSSAELVAAAVPVLTDLLDSPKALVRREVAEYVGKFGPGAAQALPSLAKRVADPDPEVRRLTVISLGMFGKSGVPGLVRALQSKEEGLPLLAVRTLREMREEAVLAARPLADLLKQDDKAMQLEVLLALGEIGPDDEPTARQIAELARVKELRDNAIVALKRMGASGATGLVLLLQGPSKVVIQSALNGLKEIGPPAVPSMARALRDATLAPFVRETLARQLGEIRDPSAVDALNDVVKDSDKRVSEAARQALARFK